MVLKMTVRLFVVGFVLIVPLDLIVWVVVVDAVLPLMRRAETRKVMIIQVANTCFFV